MLKIGLIGAGYLGKIHLKCIQLAQEHFELTGFYDADAANAARVSEQLGISVFSSPEALIEVVDIIDIVTPTTTHFELAVKAIRAGKHVFIEKPITNTLEEAEQLVALAAQHRVKVQVGHVERFNPALLALGDMELNPMFLEAHRLAVFNPRGTDVSVVLDLMIHDLDIILSLVNAPVKQVHASGVAVVSNTPDIANARIEFQNGCVANVTASRISMKQMRKVRLFQNDAYVSLDFLEKQAQVIQLSDSFDPESDNVLTIDTPNGKKAFTLSMPPIEPVNAIKMELESFADCILADTRPKVSVEDGMEALKLAYQILEAIEVHQKQAKHG